VFIALFNIISIFVFGKQIVIGYYTDLLPALMHRGMFDNPYNQSFHNLYWRLFKHGHGYSTPLVYAPNIFNILTTLTTYSIFIFSLIFIWKHRTKNDSLILAALLILTLLCSNVSWEHHYSLTIFAFIIVFKFLDENYINKYALIIFCCAYALMSVKIGYDNKLLLRGILNIFVSIRLYSAILLYFIIFLCIKFSKNNN
ncbi:MAG TPA: hypothetical protein PLM75_06420, partial [bacterium]|nr:hypothetical protein [bacterium]